MRTPVLPAAFALLLAAALTTASCAAGPGSHAGAGASSPAASGTRASAGHTAVPSPGTSTAIAVELLGPDAPVTRTGDGIPIVVRVTENGTPLRDATTTFEVTDGPAVFPDGFEAAQTDETGVATALSLSATSPGSVLVRVSTGDYAGTVTIEIR